MAARPTEAELRRGGEAATWGGAPERPRMRLIAWKPLRKNSLVGFATVELPNGLKIIECPVLESHGRLWATLPGKAQIDQDGRHKRDVNGKLAYSPVVEWRTKVLREAFSDRVVALVKQHHPETFGPQ